MAEPERKSETEAHALGVGRSLKRGNPGTLVRKIGDAPNKKIIDPVRRAYAGNQREPVCVHLGRVLIRFRRRLAVLLRDLRRQRLFREVHVIVCDFGASDEDLGVGDPPLRRGPAPSGPNHVVQHVAAVGRVHSEQRASIHIEYHRPVNSTSSRTLRRRHPHRCFPSRRDFVAGMSAPGVQKPCWATHSPETWGLTSHLRACNIHPVCTP